MSIHWGSRGASGEVVVGEEVISLSSTQLASDSDMRERGKGEGSFTLRVQASERLVPPQPLTECYSCQADQRIDIGRKRHVHEALDKALLKSQLDVTDATLETHASNVDHEKSAEP